MGNRGTLPLTQREEWTKILYVTNGTPVQSMY